MDWKLARNPYSDRYSGREDQKVWNDDLSDLKAGDEVARYYGGPPPEILKVDRITPSGQIVVGSERYRKDGGLISSGGCRWIHRVTDEMRESIRRNRVEARFRDLCGSVRWVPAEVLDRVNELLEPYRRKS